MKTMSVVHDPRCTHVLALNFDFQANFNNGTACEYADVVLI